MAKTERGLVKLTRAELIEKFKHGKIPQGTDYEALFNSIYLLDEGKYITGYTQQEIDDMIAPLNAMKDEGYVFAGIAHPSDPKKEHKAKVFYYATEVGEYKGYLDAGGQYIKKANHGVSVLKHVSAGVWEIEDVMVIAQELGESEDVVVSQKAITDGIKEGDKIAKYDNYYLYLNKDPSVQNIEGKWVVEIPNLGMEIRNKINGGNVMNINPDPNKLRWEFDYTQCLVLNLDTKQIELIDRNTPLENSILLLTNRTDNERDCPSGLFEQFYTYSKVRQLEKDAKDLLKFSSIAQNDNYYLSMSASPTISFQKPNWVVEFPKGYPIDVFNKINGGVVMTINLSPDELRWEFDSSSRLILNLDTKKVELIGYTSKLENSILLFNVRNDLGNVCPNGLLTQYLLFNEIKKYAEIVNENTTTIQDIKLKTDLVSIISNNEWLFAFVDKNNTFLFGVKVDGSTHFAKDYTNNIGISNPEWLYVYTDAKNKVLGGIKVDGSFSFPNLDKKLDKLSKDVNSLSENNLSSYSAITHKQLSKISTMHFKSWFESNTIPKLTFMHISDMHGEKGRWEEQAKFAIECLNKESEYVDFLLNTGDTCRSHFSDDYTYFLDEAKKAVKPVYVAIGNHDSGESMIVAKTGTDEQIFNKHIAPLLPTWNLKTDGGGTPHPEGKNYYFTDFTEQKVRLIIIYEFETDYELDPIDPTKIKYSRQYRAFRQTQVDWIIDSLMTTPEGYGVIICKHQPEGQLGKEENVFSNPYIGGTRHMVSYSDYYMLCDIVDAFQKGTTLKKSYAQTGAIVTTLNVDVDFSTKQKNTEFICYCSGHIHTDSIRFVDKYPNQLELNIGCHQDKTNYTSGSDMYQEKDTYMENLINVYSINRSLGQITILRIGANYSNTGQRRDMMTIKYRNV